MKGIIVDKCSAEEDKSECVVIKKYMHRMRLHMMCRGIIMYSDVEESIWIDLKFHMIEHAWPLQEKNNIRIF